MDVIAVAWSYCQVRDEANTVKQTDRQTDTHLHTDTYIHT